MPGGDFGERDRAAVAFERQRSVRQLRRRVVSMREDARYWRRRGRAETAVELERIASFVEVTVERLTASLELLKKP